MPLTIGNRFNVDLLIILASAIGAVNMVWIMHKGRNCA